MQPPFIISLWITSFLKKNVLLATFLPTNIICRCSPLQQPLSHNDCLSNDLFISSTCISSSGLTGVWQEMVTRNHNPSLEENSTGLASRQMMRTVSMRMSQCNVLSGLAISTKRREVNLWGRGLRKQTLEKLMGVCSRGKLDFSAHTSPARTGVSSEEYYQLYKECCKLISSLQWTSSSFA